MVGRKLRGEIIHIYRPNVNKNKIFSATTSNISHLTLDRGK
ncbi:MAG: hypothetical protein OFPI_25490 [Osedax symbiont Rs2]|nr:MAG: hypothetical protein OFPI_25490 [Osedax symbiont Rs2]